MSAFRSFFPDAVDQVQEKSVVVSERFKEPFVIRALSEVENARIRKSCQTIKYFGKKEGKQETIDRALYVLKLVCESVVSPNLKDHELQEAWEVMTDVDLLQKMLLPGEYADLSIAVQELNGFDLSDNDLQDEAKN